MTNRVSSQTFVPANEATLASATVSRSGSYADGTSIDDPITAELIDGRQIIVYPATQYTTPSVGNTLTQTDTFFVFAQADDGAIGAATRLADVTPIGVAASDSGGFALVATSPTGFELLQFGSQGMATQDGFVASTANTTPSGVTQLADGSYAAIWEARTGADTDILARIIGADGTPLTDSFLVNTTTQNAQFDPRISALPDGGFIAVWVSLDQDGDQEGIFLQRLDAAGAKVGPETQVNTIPTGRQLYPEVEVLQDGSWIVTWQADFLSSTYKVRLFSPDGTALGEELALPDSLNRDIAAEALPDGGFVIASTNRATDVHEITLSSFDSDGTPRGKEFTLQVPGVTAVTGSEIETWSGNGLVLSYATVTGGLDFTSHTAEAHFFDINAVPTGDVTLSGTLAQNEILRCDTSALADVDGLGDLAFHWLRDGIAIAGATAADYRLTEDDVGAQISIEVSYVDGLGVTEILTSAQSGIVPGGIIWSGGPLGDVYVGGRFDDLIKGRAGADDLSGKAGADLIKGGSGDDLIFGNRGKDDLTGNGGEDTLRGAGGDDVLTGGNGADILKGGKGRDRLDGGNGDDLIKGKDGADRLDGGNGNDLIKGKDGADRIVGGNGDDRIIGGAGDDRLTGGEGRDVFVFRHMPDNDRILDFDPSEDKIDLPATLTFALQQVGSNVEIETERFVLTLQDIDIRDLETTDMFI